MGKPAILAVDDDQLVLAAIARALRRQYSEDNQVRIWEPFFTTKLPGVGTGLGLASRSGSFRITAGQSP